MLNKSDGILHHRGEVHVAPLGLVLREHDVLGVTTECHQHPDTHVLGIVESHGVDLTLRSYVCADSPCRVPLGAARQLGEGLLRVQRGGRGRRLGQCGGRDLQLVAYVQHYFHTLVLRALVHVVPGFPCLGERGGSLACALSERRGLKMLYTKRTPATSGEQTPFGEMTAWVNGDTR